MVSSSLNLSYVWKSLDSRNKKSVFKILDTDFKETMGRDEIKDKTKKIDREQTMKKQAIFEEFVQ